MIAQPWRRFAFVLAKALGKTYGEISLIPMRELVEWNQFLSLGDEKPTDSVEDQLMNVFGGKSGKSR